MATLYQCLYPHIELSLHLQSTLIWTYICILFTLHRICMITYSQCTGTIYSVVKQHWVVYAGDGSHCTWHGPRQVSPDSHGQVFPGPWVSDQLLSFHLWRHSTSIVPQENTSWYLRKCSLMPMKGSPWKFSLMPMKGSPLVPWKHYSTQ